MTASVVLALGASAALTATAVSHGQARVAAEQDAATRLAERFVEDAASGRYGPASLVGALPAVESLVAGTAASLAERDVSVLLRNATPTNDVRSVVGHLTADGLAATQGAAGAFAVEIQAAPLHSGAAAGMTRVAVTVTTPSGSTIRLARLVADEPPPPAGAALVGSLNDLLP